MSCTGHITGYTHTMWYYWFISSCCV